MIGRLSRFLLGWPIFRGELLVSGKVVQWNIPPNGCQPKNRGVKPPKSFHFFIGFGTIIFTIHFGGVWAHPYFWFNTQISTWELSNNPMDSDYEKISHSTQNHEKMSWKKSDWIQLLGILPVGL